jgi:hypothetical protein
MNSMTLYHPKDIDATLNYTVDDGTTPWLYDRPLTRKDKHSTKNYVRVDPVTVTVRDGRAREDLSLDHHSFELVSQTTALSPEDFYDNPGGKIERVYYGEMEELLQRKMGAEKVVIFNHQVRNEVKSGSGFGGYARGIHVDYAPSWAEQRFRDILNEKITSEEERIKFSKGRFVVLNTWRNISNQPIQQDTLAVCDETSVVKPDDYILSDFYGKDNSGKQLRMASRNASKHRWYYYPSMTRDEVLVFKMYDSDTTRAARSCFHTAFCNPTAPVDAPARESIEVRAIAFFPDFEPNTCPAVSLRGGTEASVTASEAASRIQAMVESVFFWPLPIQWIFRRMMSSSDERRGAEAVIRLLLPDRGNRAGLEHAPKELKSEALTLLLKDDAFTNRAVAMKHRLDQAVAERRRKSPWFWWLSPSNW